MSDKIEKLSELDLQFNAYAKAITPTTTRNC